jgi:threonine dehydratase
MSRGPVTALDVLAARQRLLFHLPPSPLLHSAWLSDLAGAAVYLKIESLQPARSFKIRGALNALLKAGTSGREAPTIVTASAGNHGRAVAYAGERLGRRAIIFMPVTAPATKKAAIAQHGAKLHAASADYDAAERAARTFADQEGAVYLSPYNDADVIAGAGTIALELVETLPAVDVVVLPIGGGGLASGLAVAIDSVAPRVRVVGVEAEASTPFATGLARGGITRIEVAASLADGLTGNLEAGAMTFDLVRRHVDRLVAVSEPQIAAAIRGLAAEEHLIAEGAGAAATAAVLSGQVVSRGERAVVLVTGGNIDLSVLARIVS